MHIHTYPFDKFLKSFLSCIHTYEYTITMFQTVGIFWTIFYVRRQNKTSVMRRCCQNGILY